jgi:ubiquinone/menaquinone biosynthesis C-methylase UbiE
VTAHKHDGYVPALGFHALTRFYDPLLSLTLREKALKTRLVEQARIAAGHDVLDVGCGTGTLAILVATLVPGARVVGLDGDPAVLEIARRKVAAAGVDVTLREGLANTESVFPAESFDRVLTSFVLHHLTREERVTAFRTMRRWLGPGGRLDVLDFGPQGGSPFGLVARAFAALHGGERLADNLAGRLPEQMREAGFAGARETGVAFTLFGRVSFYEALP